MKPSDTGPRSNKFFPIEKTDDTEFINDVRDTYQKDLDADRHNIEPAREDLRFVIGDQWDPTLKARRNRLKKPVLTVNRLPAFVAQYLGSWQQTDTTMKLLPMKGGSKMVAEIRQGIMRTAMVEPQAKHALYTAMECAYIGGIGNFGIDLRENKFDVFVKDFHLTSFDDPFQVVWDRNSREPTGADAHHAIAMEWLTKKQFRKEYPNADSNSVGWYTDEADYSTMTSYGWEVDDMIRVAHFWQMKEEDVTVGLEAGTGDVVDVTDWSEERIRTEIAIDTDGSPMIRETTRPYAECYTLASGQVLAGPFRLNISRLPIFRVEGWALQEASVRYRWGFVRNAKDPQRLHNYWRSILAEELQKSPASKWLLDQAAMKSGLAERFRDAHASGDTVLFWDSQADGAKPEFIPPPLVNQAVITEAQMSVQDIKDVTNKHEASLGVTSNEVSGKAISARQRVSELGDRIYLENMNMAQAECARVLNELIPEVYDTARVVKLTGDDDSIVLQKINDVFGDESPDITVGKYDLTYTTGPSYATKREEAVETMLTMMNHMPQTANYVMDIVARNLDVPGADEIEERMMMMLPPGMVNLDRLPERKKAKLVQQMQEQQKAAAEQKQVEMAMLQRQLKEMEGKIANLFAQAEKSSAQARLAESQVGVDGFKAQSQHVIGIEANMIDAVEAGTSIDKTRIDVARMGMDMADMAANHAKMEKDDGGKQDGKRTGSSEESEEGSGGSDSE